MRTRTRNLRGRDVSDHVTATSPQTLGTPLKTTTISSITTTTITTTVITNTTLTTTTKTTLKPHNFILSPQACSSTSPNNSSLNSNNKKKHLTRTFYYLHSNVTPSTTAAILSTLAKVIVSITTLAF